MTGGGKKEEALRPDQADAIRHSPIQDRTKGSPSSTVQSPQESSSWAAGSRNKVPPPQTGCFLTHRTVPRAATSRIDSRGDCASAVRTSASTLSVRSTGDDVGMPGSKLTVEVGLRRKISGGEVNADGGIQQFSSGASLHNCICE